MLTVKVEGVGEGIYAELAEDMMRQSGWLSWLYFIPCFYVLFHLLCVSGGTF